MVDVLIPVGIGKERRRPGMVRMGRGETMSPGVLTWAMDSVAERYAQQDGQTLQAAGDHPHHVYNIHCVLYTIYYTLYTVHYTLYTTHYTLYTIHYTLYAYFCIYIYTYISRQLN